MQLQTQVFAEILSTLQKPGVGGGGSERRRAARIELEAPITAMLLMGAQKPQKLTVLMRDISHSGVGLLCSVAARPGDRVVVQLPRQRRDPVALLAQVRVCRELASGIYSIGAEFVEEMTEKESERLTIGQNEMNRIQNSILCGS